MSKAVKMDTCVSETCPQSRLLGPCKRICVGDISRLSDKTNYSIC